jgi:hypothetical protein
MPAGYRDLIARLSLLRADSESEVIDLLKKEGHLRGLPHVGRFSTAC